VVSGATLRSKADIERRIMECGGSVVQNPGKEFFSHHEYYRTF